MEHDEIIQIIQAFPAVTAAGMKYGDQIEIRSEADHVCNLLVFLKSQGFEHLSNITCVDWILEKRFDVTYNIWSYSRKIHAVVKIGLSRDNPRMATIYPLWPQARVYEQEIHEMFGIVFEGNPDMGPLFLHNWQDLPPLRKDFDTREYSRKMYGFLEEEAGL